LSRGAETAEVLEKAESSELACGGVDSEEFYPTCETVNDD
jgi:hypothetical protein